MAPQPETVGRIEPCLLDSYDPEVADLLAAFPMEAARLEARLHPRTAASLAELVRVMNCYYSNLIEGHDTRPRDIERSLANDFAAGGKLRNLQLEARAHLRVQQQIDRQHLAGTLPEPASLDFIRGLHRAFYDGAPESALSIQGRFRMVPGEFRSLPEHDNEVGLHQPPSSVRVAEFMDHFASRYFLEGRGLSTQLVAIAAAHHRFNLIHPFPDGNGRVSRLMSHAMLLKAGLGAHGLWSISRGLARGLGSRQDYPQQLNHADLPRQGDLDGRGNLSLAALRDFVIWFLKICLDQVGFMGKCFDLANLQARLPAWVAAHPELRPEATRLLEEVLLRGELARGDAALATGLSERPARDLLGRLVDKKILASETPKGHVRLQVTVESAEILFPALFR